MAAIEVRCILFTHHLMTNDQKHTCPYCLTELKGKSWSSLFYKGTHYKTLVCGCNNKIVLKVNFESSGHDGWDGTNAWREHIAPKKPDTASICVLENIVQKMTKETK